MCACNIAAFVVSIPVNASQSITAITTVGDTLMLHQKSNKGERRTYYHPTGSSRISTEA